VSNRAVRYQSHNVRWCAPLHSWWPGVADSVRGRLRYLCTPPANKSSVEPVCVRKSICNSTRSRASRWWSSDLCVILRYGEAGVNCTAVRAELLSWRLVAQWQLDADRKLDGSAHHINYQLGQTTIICRRPRQQQQLSNVVSSSPLQATVRTTKTRSLSHFTAGGEQISGDWCQRGRKRCRMVKSYCGLAIWQVEWMNEYCEL